MKQKSTQNSVQSSLRCSAIFLLLFFFCGTATMAHKVTYYDFPCINASQTAVVKVKVTFCSSTTWYHWQYRLNNGAPGAWIFLSNGSNTINGTPFTVSNASLKTNVADSCASLTIAYATTALNNVELRVLMGDNADPQVVTSPVWGGNDQALFEAKSVRIKIRPGNEYCYTDCSGNALVITQPSVLNTPVTDFYGGFESGSSNFGGTHTNGSSVTAQTEIVEWPINTTLGTASRYSVTNHPDTVNTAFTSFAPHSGRQMMVVSRSTDATKKIWHKTIVAETSPAQKYYLVSGSMNYLAAELTRYQYKRSC
jgi:hypothetical protein